MEELNPVSVDTAVILDEQVQGDVLEAKAREEFAIALKTFSQQVSAAADIAEKNLQSLK